MNGDEGFCALCRRVLPPLLDAVAKESTGAIENDDVECVHRMRVASRRMRSALSIFEPCFPRKRAKAWKTEMKSVTEALGEARDADVQIIFLVERMAATEDRTLAPGLRHLLDKKRRRRRALQPGLEKTLNELRLHGVLDEISSLLADPEKKDASPLRTPSTLRQADEHVSRRVSELRGHEESVRDPDAILEHHVMRIAAKRLRYTLEAFRLAFGDELRDEISRIKRLQELLGEMHDCDVWIAETDAVLQNGKKNGGSRLAAARPGIISLHEDRKKERTRLYLEFVAYWESLAKSDFFPSLLRKVQSERAVPVAKQKLTEEQTLEKVWAVADKYLADEGHTRQVTRLALLIFERARDLHGLGEKERRLLHWAAVLHDVGWVEGRQGHHRTSMRIIQEEADLPFSERERNIVALIARYHRKRMPGEEDEIYVQMKKAERTKVDVLAALLRVADGLDRTHRGLVKDVRVRVTDEEVLLSISSDEEAKEEQEEAQKKGDLLVRTFAKRLRIAREG
jgi:CHAD domain-containing protein